MNVHVRDNLNALERVLDRGASVSVTNTTTETNVYSFSVPGGTMGANDALRLTLIGDHYNESGAAANLLIAVLFGGTAFAGINNWSLDSATTRRRVWLSALVGNLNSTALQAASALVHIGNSGSGDTAANWQDAGTAQTAAAGRLQIAARHDLAINTSSAAAVTVAITHGTAHANISFRQKYVVLEHMRL